MRESLGGDLSALVSCPLNSVEAGYGLFSSAPPYISPHYTFSESKGKQFGSRSTAKQVSAGIDMSGKVVIITGSNTGIGKETAKVLAMRGAHVIMACRDANKAAQAVNDIQNATQNQQVEAMSLDLSSFDSIRQFAAAFQERGLPLHVLINNAGIMACPYATTADGFESQFGVCHLGHFLLTGLLLPILKATAPSRIVVLSSLAHKYGNSKVAQPYTDAASYSRYTAYANAKLANLMFSRVLAEKLRGTGVTCNAVHPGIIQTELTRSDNCAKCYFCLNSAFNKSIPQGAATTVLAACHPSMDGVQGAYLVDCAEEWPSKLARNDDIAQELWNVSEQMTGIQY